MPPGRRARRGCARKRNQFRGACSYGWDWRLPPWKTTTPDATLSFQRKTTERLFYSIAAARHCAGGPERARMSSLSDCTISDGDPWATRSSSNTRRCTRSSPPPFVPTQRLPSRSSSAPGSGTQLSDVLHAPARIEHQELSNLSNGAHRDREVPQSRQVLFKLGGFLVMRCKKRPRTALRPAMQMFHHRPSDG